MTRVRFLGVGEACDEQYPNTSILVSSVISGKPVSAMLDCGFTAPFEYWKYARDPDELDAVWISHFHGDHCFGVPVLLLRFWEMKRRKPLLFIGQEGVKQYVEKMMELAYPGFRKKLSYPLEFQLVDHGDRIDRVGLHWTFAENDHSQRCLAVRLEHQGKALFYSGDGCPNIHTRQLASGCELIIHEAFAAYETTVPGHGTVNSCIEFARESGARRLALVHVQRDVRREQISIIKEMMSRTEDLEVLLPEPGDEISI